jgi:pimeloyl-ACP methyl ester carboxylesterase
MKHAILLSLMLAAFVPSSAADGPQAPNRFATTIVPAERFEVGAMLVQRHGERGTPIILVPGLAGGAWVWEDTVRRLKERHVLYVVTLPGFDGRPPAPGFGFAQAQDALAQLIVARKLSKPVVVGHSMGGILGLSLAQRQPDHVGGVVAIDGLPVFPGTEDMPPFTRMKMAAGATAGMLQSTQPKFAAEQQAYMRGVGVTDMARADELAKLSARSDPRAAANYMSEVLALDLREGLSKIKGPVLVIAPWQSLDNAQDGQPMADKVAHYSALMAGTPRLEVLAIPGARHFVMFDQPQALADALDRYLKSF